MRDLAVDIVILDHRANHQLRPKTREWDEVVKLLYIPSGGCLPDSWPENRDIKFGNPSETWANGIYLVTSFLCGFSERFAKDIISRVPLGGTATNGSEQALQ